MKIKFHTKFLPLMACAAFTALFMSTQSNAAVYIGPVGSPAVDTWNTAANWNPSGVPTGTVNVEIESGRTTWANNSTPSYTGNLTLKTNSTLGVGVTGGNNTQIVLGTSVNTSTITMESGSNIIMRYSSNYTFNQVINLTGTATIALSSSTNGHNATRTFATGMTGAHTFALAGQNGNIANLNASNAFTSFTANDGGSDNWKVVANAAGSLGVGNVTINNSANLVLNQANAMFASAELFLNGPRSTKVAGENKLVLNNNHNHIVAGLYINNTPVAFGTYNSTSGLLDSGGNNLISGNGSITVIPEPSAALLGGFGMLLLLRRRR